MISDERLRAIYKQYKTIAVYGMSIDPQKPSHSVPAFLLSQGYQIIPINPKADKIIGCQSYSDLADIPEIIDILEIFRPSTEALEVVKKAVARKEARGDIAVIWLQQGIKNETARELAQQAGLIFIQDRCMCEEFNRLFPEKEGDCHPAAAT